MKVGTDGVLLGAWTPVGEATRILDVGSGTGLVAMMLAQRSLATIDAVELDESAFWEANQNFENSPWRHRLRIIHADFQLFDIPNHELYDLVVSNPPFFINSLKTKDLTLAIARHNHTLSFDQLILGARKVLNDQGRLCVIIPSESFTDFRESARLAGFFLRQQTRIIPKMGRVPKRVLLEFSLQKGFPIENELTILGESGVYTDEFKLLTAPFYPAF